ncbi:hypothetical protein HBI04_076590 [Parastagonospora nodorum]|nr:hypothetical protein HBI03_061140 [Parastagonospora nodorum]KAH4279298.1 hypothetical protein HBI04_076590 [Parastagonospora nodorum]KAH4856295.1 hypothetical protein HBH75_079090 [Parastagonospora nodorum]
MDSFDQTLDALNPCINKSPIFHQFTQLPLEIRYQIYESYFHSSPEFVPCKEGNHPSQSHIVPCSQLPKGSFLPSLCLVDRNIGEEATSFLARTAIFDVKMKSLMTSRDICPAEIFTRNLIESPHQHIGRKYNVRSRQTLKSGAPALTSSPHGPARIQISVRRTNTACGVDAPVIDVYAAAFGGTGFE